MPTPRRDEAGKGCLSATIRSMTPVRGGSGLCVSLIISDGEHEEEQALTIAAEAYAGLRFLHPYGKAAGRVLSEDQLAELDAASTLFAAIERGLNLLAYGDATEDALVRKLRERGFDAGVALDAACRLRERGYIDEPEQLARFVRLSLRKGWGPARIAAAAREKRFSRDTLEQLPELLADVDFAEACAAVITKKWGSLPTDPSARRKSAAALMRLGYSWGEIQAGEKLVREE